MSENNPTQTVVLESPASWNTKYLDTKGFVCQLTLRAETGTDLLNKVGSAINHLIDQGCLPVGITPNYSYKGNGQTSVDKPTDSHLCPIHQVEMKKYEKNGRSWYAHHNGDSWCSGKLK